MTRHEWTQWFFGLSFGFSMSSIAVSLLTPNGAASAVWVVLIGGAAVFGVLASFLMFPRRSR